jgi:uncharacterized protein (UPF0548 family)
MELSIARLPTSSDVDEARGLRTNFETRSGLREKQTAIPLVRDNAAEQYDTSFVFNYDIFPASLMRARTEWEANERSIRAGDIIVQRAILPPIGVGIALQFAVRISHVFDEDAKRGFAYETLTGHPERGVSQFYFERRRGTFCFVIHTWSEPSDVIPRAFHPVAAWYQAWCTQRALAHVKRRFHEVNNRAARRTIGPS